MRLMSGRGVGECGSGRHWYGGVGVISEVGRYSLCGACLRGFCLAPRNLVVWVGESGSGSAFPRGKQFMVRLLLCSWAQGAGVAIAASKRAR